MIDGRLFHWATESLRYRSDSVEEGTVLWSPSPDRISHARLSGFLAWLAAERGLLFKGYPELWLWSVESLEEFWSCILEYFNLGVTGDSDQVLVRGTGAEGAIWFPKMELNYVDQILRHPSDAVALVACSESGSPEYLTYHDLIGLVGAAAAGLRRLGVGRGDRVVAVLTNGPAAVVSFLATASLGAVWSSCAPEFGSRSMVDRFRQIQPKVLLMAEGYQYGGRRFDLGSKLSELEAQLDELVAVVIVPIENGSQIRPDSEAPDNAADLPKDHVRISWAQLLSDPSSVEPVSVPFGHPLWILYSSGTTGLPKPIVHGHGGILLEHLKALSFHCDLGPGERFFWFTTTGWMMWNFLVGGLLVGSAIVCYDGDPMWPDQSRLWRMAQDVGITYFGTSAPYLDACRKSGYSPRREGQLLIHSLGSTGSPLSPEGYVWATEQIGDDVLVGSISGGSDVCTAFLVSCPLLQVRAGELQCRALGVKAEAYDESGEPVVDDVGELVVTEPMPSMPVGMWADDGKRLHDAYFSQFEGVWRHGDWVRINSDGGSVVFGRSDATLNRGGVRSGTAEFYRAVESLAEIDEALVVDTSELGSEGELLLFVVLASSPKNDSHIVVDHTLDKVRQALREHLSPRHVPDQIIVVPALPRTINGKKIEVPIRRILLGANPEEAVAAGALDDPEALDGLVQALKLAGLA